MMRQSNIGDNSIKVHRALSFLLKRKHSFEAAFYTRNNSLVNQTLKYYKQPTCKLMCEQCRRCKESNGNKCALVVRYL